MEYRKLTEEEYRDLESRILYEDNHLFIVNKKVGEIVQSDMTGDECLTDAYKAFIAQRDAKPGKVFLGAAHRIDRPVSGICILAKTTKSLGRLSDMFRNGEIHKKYWALCYDAPEPREGHLESSRSSTTAGSATPTATIWSKSSCSPADTIRSAASSPPWAA